MSNEKILNLTQHEATPEQIEAGVVEPLDKEMVRKFLTFDTKPDAKEIFHRAYELADYAARCRFTKVMIGGAPYLMGPLERYLDDMRITPLYSYSIRQSVDHPNPDGSVGKVAVFKHSGWVEVRVI